MEIYVVVAQVAVPGMSGSDRQFLPGVWEFVDLVEEKVVADNTALSLIGLGIPARVLVRYITKR